MATCSSTLAWRIPCTEEPGGLQSTGSQRVGHSWARVHTWPAMATSRSPSVTVSVFRETYSSNFYQQLLVWPLLELWTKWSHSSFVSGPFHSVMRCLWDSPCSRVRHLFLFHCWQVFSCVNTPQFIYPLHCQSTCGQFPAFSLCNLSCCLTFWYRYFCVCVLI